MKSKGGRTSVSAEVYGQFNKKVKNIKSYK